MKWYWAISCSNAIHKLHVSSTGNLNGHENWEFKKGQYIENWNPLAWIKCSEPEWNGEPDDVLQTHLAIPIFSPRLQEVIDNAQFSGIQFLPIQVLRLHGNEIPRFAIANILNIPSAMDMEKSLYDRFESAYFIPEDRGKVAGVYRMVLKQASLRSYDVIRVKEFHQSIYVSERFKHEFEAAQCTGYSFQDVQLS